MGSPPPLDPEAAAKKAKSKAAHRASMLFTGFWMLGCGLAAAYLVMSRGGDLPAFMYGHLRMPARAPVGGLGAGAALRIYAKSDPAQARAVLEAIERTLGDRAGGYYAAAAVPGVRAPDRRILASQNGEIIAAVFDSREALAGAGQPLALKTLDLWWSTGVRGGAVSRQLGASQPVGLLEDQLALAEAFAAAFEAKQGSGQLDRALSLAGWIEKKLSVAGSGRLRECLSGPATAREAELNHKALIVFRRIAADLPASDLRRTPLEGRLRALSGWLNAKPPRGG